MTPRISIIMPVWNGEKFIAAAVDSLLAQTFTDFELLVIDDGSTDHTPEILRGYTDPRVRIFRLDHAGIVVALNHGLAQARADWIARLDADDLSLPRRLELQWQEPPSLGSFVPFGRRAFWRWEPASRRSPATALAELYSLAVMLSKPDCP